MRLILLGTQVDAVIVIIGRQRDSSAKIGSLLVSRSVGVWLDDCLTKRRVGLRTYCAFELANRGSWKDAEGFGPRE